MIISNLNHLEVVGENTKVQGGLCLDYNTNNSFNTTVNSPTTGSNSAAAGSQGVANNNTCLPTYSYTKADTVAATDYLGGSFSASTSAAVINKPC